MKKKKGEKVTEAVMGHVLTMAKQQLNAEMVSVLLYDAEAEELVSWWSTRKERRTRQPCTAGIAGLSFSSARPMNVAKVRDVDNSSPTGYVARSVMCIPLFADKLLGVVQFVNKKHDEPSRRRGSSVDTSFSPEDQDLAVGFATVAAGAVAAAISDDKRERDDLKRHVEAIYDFFDGQLEQFSVIQAAVEEASVLRDEAPGQMPVVEPTLKTDDVAMQVVDAAIAADAALEADAHLAADAAAFAMYIQRHAYTDFNEWLDDFESISADELVCVHSSSPRAHAKHSSLRAPSADDSSWADKWKRSARRARMPNLWAHFQARRNKDASKIQALGRIAFARTRVIERFRRKLKAKLQTSLSASRCSVQLLLDEAGTIPTPRDSLASCSEDEDDDTDDDDESRTRLRATETTTPVLRGILSFQARVRGALERRAVEVQDKYSVQFVQSYREAIGAGRSPQGKLPLPPRTPHKSSTPVPLPQEGEASGVMPEVQNSSAADAQHAVVLPSPAPLSSPGMLPSPPRSRKHSESRPSARPETTNVGPVAAPRRGDFAKNAPLPRCRDMFRRDTLSKSGPFGSHRGRHVLLSSHRRELQVVAQRVRCGDLLPLSKGSPSCPPRPLHDGGSSKSSDKNGSDKRAMMMLIPCQRQKPPVHPGWLPEKRNFIVAKTPRGSALRRADELPTGVFQHASRASAYVPISPRYFLPTSHVNPNAYQRHQHRQEPQPPPTVLYSRARRHVRRLERVSRDQQGLS